MSQTHLHPTAEDAVQQVVDRYREAKDYRVEGEHVLVKIAVTDHTADHYRDVSTATPGMMRLHKSEHFTYDTSQFTGRDDGGSWQFIIKFIIHDSDPEYHK